jgi:hypothetical protein
MFGFEKAGKGFALIAITVLAGCQSPSPDAVETRVSALTSGDILGFEAVSGWSVTQGPVQSIALTTTRTKGASALALTKPSGNVRIDSAKLASTTPELMKIERGVYAAVDFMLPTEQVSPYWTGAVQMYVSVPSRNLYNAYLGQVDLTGTRTAVYSTLRFQIPDATADVIKGATFSDLTFGIVVNVPVNSPGVYRLDNLRIKGKKPPAPTDETQITPGQSILLVASKAYSPASSTPAQQTFTQGIIQIPASFHAVTGAVGTGSATFEYALGTGANVVCQYTADTSSGRDYKFASCAGGARSGDLVPATFVRLTIVNGASAAGTTKVRAQIALNPVEDDILGGLPPIPTYFGTTAAEVAASLNTFVQAQRSWQSPGFVRLHLPTPAIPVQDSVIVNGTALPPSRSSNTDPPFGIGGRLTNSDLADAGWHANGSIDAPVDSLGARNTSFDLDVGADIYLLGGSTTILGLTGHAESHTPAPSAGSIPPTDASAHFCYGYFGFAQQCQDFSGTAGINKEIANATPHFALPSINYWIFSVAASVDLSLKATLTGGFTPNGVGLAISPDASVSATLRGGLSAGGFIGAGLFVTAKLIGITVPINFGISALLNLQPGSCSVDLKETLTAQAIVTAGSGTIGYYVEAGICCGCFVELCWRDEGDIYSWPGYSRTIDIVPATPLANQSIKLDTASVCPAIASAPGQIAYPFDGETFNQNDRSFTKATFSIDFNSSGGTQHIILDHQVWTSDCATDLIASNGSIWYGDCPTRLLTVVATSTSSPSAGSGTGSVRVNVNPNPSSTAITPITLAPGFGEEFLTNCNGLASVVAMSTYNNPDGDTTSVTWYSDTFSRHGLDPNNDQGTQLGTGLNAPLLLNKSITIIRVIDVDVGGHRGMTEIPIFVATGCPV